MKMFFMGYDDYFDEPVTEAFTGAGVRSYLKLYRGARSSGKANAVFIPVPDEELPALLEVVRGLKAKYPDVGIRAFTFPLEECV
ncbi:MAG: hypothetical protein A4E60_02514 [Syntrophorhabdus sp. PtaB.Bin047]|jgi:hypothetical protein|nr:MAG: hypothetical protein A4E60_02514 [Syntrophorhabdus sp. PtaB.Bin047]